MLVLLTSVRRASWLALVGLLLVAPQARASTAAYLHLDGDGTRDEVTVDRLDPTLVTVRLSASGIVTAIHSARPLQQVIAVDLDGDRRPELVGRDDAHGLYVWTPDARDKYRSYRPWRAPRKAPVPSSSNSVDDDPLTGDDALPEASRVTAPLVTESHLRAPAAGIARCLPAPAAGPRHYLLTLASAPRPPPASIV